jgi:hypothetical protein
VVLTTATLGREDLDADLIEARSTSVVLTTATLGREDLDADLIEARSTSVVLTTATPGRDVSDKMLDRDTLHVTATKAGSTNATQGRDVSGPDAIKAQWGIATLAPAASEADESKAPLTNADVTSVTRGRVLGASQNSWNAEPSSAGQVSATAGRGSDTGPIKVSTSAEPVTVTLELAASAAHAAVSQAAMTLSAVASREPRSSANRRAEQKGAARSATKQTRSPA